MVMVVVVSFVSGVVAALGVRGAVAWFAAKARKIQSEGKSLIEKIEK